jgi:hypothetical protein
MFRHGIVYRENGVMAPTSAAAILGILAAGSYGTPRTDILKTLTNNKAIELMLEDEAEFASRLCSMDACEGFERIKRCTRHGALLNYRKRSYGEHRPCSRLILNT